MPEEEVERPVRFLSVEMPVEMQNKAVEKINSALSQFDIEKDMATFVKRAFDEEFEGTWHCVVGRNFGCSVTHETQYLVFFEIEQMHVLLFKSS